jgi:hypothetical protein
MDVNTFHRIFLFFLIGATLISFYLFIDVLILKNNKYSNFCNTWQFPMLLAIMIEVLYSIGV